MPKFIIVHYEEDPEAILKFASLTRQLWSDHVDYTRNAIISVLGSLNDINAVADRLDKTSTDLGELIATYYGDAAGVAFTTALNEHVAIITDIIRYKKALRDTTELETNLDNNAVAIADFMASLDPSNWDKTTVLECLRTHIKYTMDEINARAEGDWVNDIAAYDMVRCSIKTMADTMSAGILDKFPEKFVKYDI